MSEYLKMRREATILRDEGNYDLAASQMNPVIFEDFVGVLLDADILPAIWEPFAGPVEKSRFMDFAEEIGITLLSQTLHPVDKRIVAADSTAVGPGQAIGGMLFHPPYYASVPLSSDERDVVLGSTKEDYMARLGAVIAQGEACLIDGGLVCAVARDYRIRGDRIRLDLWMLELFEPRGYHLMDVWTSEPDVVLIFRRRR